MDNIDWSLYYHSWYDKYFDGLTAKQNQIKTKFPTKADNIRLKPLYNKINTALNNELLIGGVKKDKVSNRKILFENRFLNELHTRFHQSPQSYPGFEPIENFVKYDIPELKKLHKNKLNIHPHAYNWRTNTLKWTSRDLLKILAKHNAYYDFTNNSGKKRKIKIHEKVVQKKPKQGISNLLESNNPMVKWTHQGRSAKTDFVKLIYALHEAQFINQGNGQITKIVPYLATIFGVNLGKDWESNHSKSRNSGNNDKVKTKIFDDLKTAYIHYMNTLRER